MRAVALALVLVAPFVLPATPQGACDDDCDKEAAACVDACETKHPDDPSARVGCKLKCSEKRVTCSDSCAKKGR